jgi:uncharacterized protein
VTDESKKKNIAAELARGGEAMEEAELLLGAHKLPGAVSRAYYAVFHHARALLLTLGLEAKSHGGLERLIHRDFVRANKLDASIALALSRLMKLRQDADYTAEFVFVEKDVAFEIDAAKKFVEAVRDVLIAEGWIAKP